MNETVELQCQGQGSPTPTITWLKNDLNINFANNPRFFQKSTGSLQISRSQKSDSGKYTCVATNSLGSKRANATLRVLSFHVKLCIPIIPWKCLLYTATPFLIPYWKPNLVCNDPDKPNCSINLLLFCGNTGDFPAFKRLCFQTKNSSTDGKQVYEIKCISILFWKVVSFVWKQLITEVRKQRK